MAAQSFEAVASFFARCVQPFDPADADYHFVPINLIEFQFANEDPGGVVDRLRFLGERPDHILVATGDFSQRSKRNHQGEAYLNTYDWLDPFVLLAHESTSDLIPGQDIGIPPYHALSDRPIFNHNRRPFLYSFLGELRHRFMGPDHVRSRLAEMDLRAPDVFVGPSLGADLRGTLRSRWTCGDDYELLARNSVFTLAPAGYGRWTSRFFQAIRWGSIPVLISDDYRKPFADSIPYETFCVTIRERDLDDLDSILRGFSASEIEELQRALEANQATFTKEAFFSLLAGSLERMRSNARSIR